MTEFDRTHAALFDALERQGVVEGVMIGRLTSAVLRALEIISSHGAGSGETIAR